MGAGQETRMRRTRGSILDAARGLFLQSGYLPTSMDEIAAAARVSKQTVYAHFHTKEALFLELVDSMTGGAGDDFKSQVVEDFDDRPVEPFLIDYAERLLTVVMTPELMRLRRLVIGEVARFPELGRTLHARGPARSIGRLTRTVEHYWARGELAVEDPRKAATLLNWLIMGEPTHDAMLMGDEAIPSPARLRAHGRAAVGVFLAAFGV